MLSSLKTILLEITSVLLRILGVWTVLEEAKLQDGISKLIGSMAGMQLAVHQRLMAHGDSLNLGICTTVRLTDVQVHLP